MVMVNPVYRGPGSFIDPGFVHQRQNIEEASAGGFADTLRGVLGEVNRLQHEADQALDQLMTGDLQNLHQVMIKTEEAQLSLQMTVQVVNKVIQAYQEIARIQI